MTDRLRIVVTGLAVTYPFGGVFWDYMHYVLGFHRLGHEVLYLEDTGQWCYRPHESTFSEDGAQNARAFERAIRRLDADLADSWFYRDATGVTFGKSREDVTTFCRSADMFVNISAAAQLRDEYVANARTVFIDSDPLYTQASIPEYADGSIAAVAKRRVDAMLDHDVFFTFGENIGKPGCSVPSELIQWRPTRQPIVVDQFAPARVPIGERRQALTTVGSWQPSTRPVMVRGVAYRGKSTQFDQFIDLPDRSPIGLELALSGELPRERLQRHGWRLVEPLVASGDPWSYRRYLSSSFAEWSVAKDAYVASRSGWFSCRSACYLAAGVPVVVQDTAFDCSLPTGEGVLPFSTMDDAVGAIEQVTVDPDRHSAAASLVAREFFDSSKVLTRLVEEVFSAGKPMTGVA